MDDSKGGLWYNTNNKMSVSAIDRLGEAIGYPDRIPDGVSSFTFRVDGMEIVAETSGGRLILRHMLTEDEGLFARLAGFAAGRMLKEAAVLAAERPDGGGLFVWQDASSDASAHDLLRLFETFCASCDWWRERVESVGGVQPQFGPEQMVMRP